MRNRLGYILVILLVLILPASGCTKQGAPAAAEPAISVSTVAVETRDIAQKVNYAGYVRGINEVKIIPKVSSRVTAINVKAGDSVSAGQTLLILDSTDYAAGVKRAEAAVASAEAALQTNKINLESARLNYERTKGLHEQGGVSNQVLESAKAAYDALNSGAAEAGLLQAQAGLMDAQNAISHCVITAPISGTVGSISLSLGDTSSMQTPAASITETSRLQVDIMVSENDISYIKIGDVVEVNVKAAAATPFSGQVSSVGNMPEAGKNNYLVKVVLDNPDGIIKSGMFADVTVDTVNKGSVLAVPINAVINKGGRLVVYTVDQEQRAREVEVKTGLKNREYIEIVSGIQAGQTIINAGNSLVNDGSLVEVAAGGGQ